MRDVSEINAINDLKRRQRTPEQQKRYEEVSQRTRAIQEHGVPAPASGIFGSRPKEKKSER